jgi:hypothetical protein
VLGAAFDTPRKGNHTMNRYFWAANLWAIITLAMIVGRSPERYNPTYYSVFHLGQWFSPEVYGLLIVAGIAVSTFFLVMTWKTRGRP